MFSEIVKPEMGLIDPSPFALWSHDQDFLICKICIYENKIYTWSQSGSKFSTFAYVSKCCHMDIFAYVCKFANICKSVHVTGVLNNGEGLGSKHQHCKPELKKTTS